MSRLKVVGNLVLFPDVYDLCTINDVVLNRVTDTVDLVVACEC